MNEHDFNYRGYMSQLNRHKVMASRCESCGSLHLPPRPLCPSCFEDEMTWVELSGKGELAAFTTIHIGTSAMIVEGYDRSHPYCTGIVRLEEGPSISAQILGFDAARPESIAIGTALRAAFIDRDKGDEQRTHLAFEPVQER